MAHAVEFRWRDDLFLQHAMGRLAGIAVGRTVRSGVTQPPRRGRPARNDAETLQKLAALIRSTHNLSPTTGLKLLGFTDPSDIRRLRDKHRNFRRIIPGKSDPHLDEVYLNRLFDRLKGSFDPSATIQFSEKGISIFARRRARTLHIPGRASAQWVKTVFIPRVSRILREARDDIIQDAVASGTSVDEVAAHFGMTSKAVYRLRERRKKAA